MSWWRGRPSRLAAHSALYGTAGVVGKAAALVTVPYLTRELGPDGYGLADLATSLSALLTLIVRFGGEIPVMRMTATATDRTARGVSLTSYLVATVIVSALVTLAMLPGAGVIATVLWTSPDANTVALIALFLVPVSAVQAALINVLRIVERPGLYAVLAIVDLISQLVLAVTFVALGMGALGVLLGFLAGSTIGLVAAGVVARRHLGPRADFGVAFRIIRQGLPFLPGLAAFVLADTISRMAAANVLAVSSVGHLALAIRMASVMSLVAYAFSMAWGPFGLSLERSQPTRDLMARVLGTQALVLGTMTLGIGAFAPELTAIVGGPGYEPAAAVLPALLLSAGLAAPLYVLITAASISNRGRWVAWSSVLGALLQLVFVVVLLPVIGLVGFAIASLSGRLASFSLLAWAVSGTARIDVRVMLTIAAILIGVVAVQVANGTPETSLGIRLFIALAALVFGTGLTRSAMRAPPSTFHDLGT